MIQKYYIAMIYYASISEMDFPGSSADKESTCNTGDPGSILGSGRSPGEGVGYPLQYSCLENSMDRGACWTIVHGIAKSRTQLSDFTTERLIVSLFTGA